MPMVKIQNPILHDTTKVLLIALVFAQGPGCFLGWALIDGVKWCKKAVTCPMWVTTCATGVFVPA